MMALALAFFSRQMTGSRDDDWADLRSDTTPRSWTSNAGRFLEGWLRSPNWQPKANGELVERIESAWLCISKVLVSRFHGRNMPHAWAHKAGLSRPDSANVADTQAKGIAF